MGKHICKKWLMERKRIENYFVSSSKTTRIVNKNLNEQDSDVRRTAFLFWFQFKTQIMTVLYQLRSINPKPVVNNVFVAHKTLTLEIFIDMILKKHKVRNILFLNNWRRNNRTVTWIKHKWQSDSWDITEVTIRSLSIQSHGLTAIIQQQHKHSGFLPTLWGDTWMQHKLYDGIQKGF